MRSAVRASSERMFPDGVVPVRARGRRRAVLGLFALAAAAVPASLGQSVVTNTAAHATPWSESSPSEFTVSLQQLNTNVANFGSVLSIELRMFATNLADITIENWDPARSNDVRVTVSSTTYGSNGEQELTVAKSHTYFSPLARTNLAPNTGTNWSGPDTVFFDNLQVSGASSNLITSGFASLYFGNGSFEYQMYSDASFGQSGTASLGASYADLRSIGVVEVIYTYTLVPEPDAIISAALASVALVVFGRRRRRRRAAAAVGEG